MEIEASSPFLELHYDSSLLITVYTGGEIILNPSGTMATSLTASLGTSKMWTLNLETNIELDDDQIHFFISRVPSRGEILCGNRLVRLNSGGAPAFTFRDLLQNSVSYRHVPGTK